MSRVIDISVPVHPAIPVWPGSPGVRFVPLERLETGGQANVTRLDTDVHVGTHVDAPLHFIAGGASVDRLALDGLVGPAYLIQPPPGPISAMTLNASGIPAHTRRLLVKTRDRPWWNDPFRRDFAALSADAAQWVVDRGIRLVGIDYLSIQRFDDPPDTHRVLLRAGVIIVEGLNLVDAVPGTYELVCLPLKLVGVEGAPARAILRSSAPA